VSFDLDVARNGHGVALQLEVSTDRFGGIAYFWSNVAHEWAGITYDPIIVSAGRLTRGLTVDHNVAASTVEVVLNNVDGVVDWMVNRSTVETSVFKAKFRLYVVSYDPAAPGTLSRKQLGQFGLLDWPKRDARSVTLSLADDTVIDGAEFALAPSVKDWVTHSGSNAGNNPLCQSASMLVDGAEFFLPYEAPVQLAFGAIAVPLQKTADWDGPSTSPNYAERVYMVCATTDVGDVTTYDVQSVYLLIDKLADFQQPGVAGHINPQFEIPQKVFYTNGSSNDIWTPRRSQILTKDGKQWRLIWVQMNMDRLYRFLQYSLTGAPRLTAGGTWRGMGGVPSLYSQIDFVVYGGPYSSRTVPSTSTPGFGQNVRAPEVAYDLLSFYSKGLSNADVDLPSFQQATQVLPGFFASGIIDDLVQLSVTRYADTSEDRLINQNFTKIEAIGGKLRQTLAELARSGSFDIVTGWDGRFKAVSQTSSLTDQVAAAGGTLATLDETLIIDGQWEDRVPSAGERYSPHNRLYIEGPNGRIGPFDNAAAIAAWGRIMPTTLSTKWVRPEEYSTIASNPNLALFNTASLESKARQRLRFSYGSLEALALDIGSYFKFTITRDGVLNPVFSNAIFRVEQIDFLPATMSVYIEAIWFDDLVSDRPYFLDDETYSLVVSGSVARTATVADGSSTVTFSSGDLLADGVQVGGGDVLVLKDTMGDTLFSRYRSILIKGVTDATHLLLQEADLDFGGGAAVSSWEIHRGATTYALLKASSPANYPTTAHPPLYGKVTDSAGLFSDSSAGNKLLDG
jgi:hypothetical protein